VDLVRGRLLAFAIARPCPATEMKIHANAPHPASSRIERLFSNSKSY
jgi:hypothetical protein